MVIDHHEAEKISEFACVINNQLCDYPTKSLSGVGMVYKFCSYIDEMLTKLVALGTKNVILTGVSYKEGTTGIVVYENGTYNYYEHPFLPNSCHGTGDIYASAFVGALVRGKDSFEAAKIAAEYTLECIRLTAKLPNHWYGAAFEPALSKLISMLA